MLSELLKNTKFQSTIKEFYKDNPKKIVDIILFGSVVKGKTKPNDIDLLLITKKDIETSVVYSLRKSLESLTGFKINITQTIYLDLFKETFLAREAFISEGYSLISKKNIAQGLGFNNFYLFRYDLSGLNKSQRMMFYYSLYGRGKSKGMLKETGLIKLSDNILLSPTTSIEETKEYLTRHNIKFAEFPILIPERVLPII